MVSCGMMLTGFGVLAVGAVGLLMVVMSILHP